MQKLNSVIQRNTERGIRSFVPNELIIHICDTGMQYWHARVNTVLVSGRIALLFSGHMPVCRLASTIDSSYNIKVVQKCLSYPRLSPTSVHVTLNESINNACASIY